jgi:hypothetical protein
VLIEQKASHLCNLEQDTLFILVERGINTFISAPPGIHASPKLHCFYPFPGSTNYISHTSLSVFYNHTYRNSSNTESHQNCLLSRSETSSEMPFHVHYPFSTSTKIIVYTMSLSPSQCNLLIYYPFSSSQHVSASVGHPQVLVSMLKLSHCIK